MSEAEAVAIRLDENRCSKCGICYSVCPFEAISLDTDTRGVRIDAEKCQLCGICASLCPSFAIELAYYDYQSLVDQVKTQKEVLKTENLVIMCRGSSPSSCDILDVLKEQNVGEFIPLRVPCVGRLQPEFYLKANFTGQPLSLSL